MSSKYIFEIRENYISVLKYIKNEKKEFDRKYILMKIVLKFLEVTTFEFVLDF